MHYNIWLQYNVNRDLNINNDDYGTLYEFVHAHIMYLPADPVTDDDEAIDPVKIGFVNFLQYNQSLAITYGVNMTRDPFITLQQNSEALLALDYTVISQETIDAIGTTTNPNIMVLQHFGIAAEFRNKGIGEQVLKGIIRQMKGQYGYLLILNSQPQQCREKSDPASLYKIQGVDLIGLEADPEKAQHKLNTFFQRCGVKPFNNHYNAFICNIDQAVIEPGRAVHPLH